MLRNLSLKAKLLCALAILSILSVMSSTVAIVALTGSRASVETLYQHRLQGVALLDNAKVALFSMQGAILSAGGTAPADEAIMGRLVADLDQTWRVPRYAAVGRDAQAG